MPAQSPVLFFEYKLAYSVGPVTLHSFHFFSSKQPNAPTVFFGVLHPRNVHNLMGWVQEYEKKSTEKVRFPYSSTIYMYSKNENFFDTSPPFTSLLSSNKQNNTSPLIRLMHLVQQAK